MYNEIDEKPRTAAEAPPPRGDDQSGQRQGRPYPGRACRPQVNRPDRQQRNPAGDLVCDPSGSRREARRSELRGSGEWHVTIQTLIRSTLSRRRMAVTWSLFRISATARPRVTIWPRHWHKPQIFLK